MTQEEEELIIVAKLLKLRPARGLTRTSPHPVLEVQGPRGWTNITMLGPGHFRMTEDPHFDFAFKNEEGFWEFHL